MSQRYEFPPAIFKLAYQDDDQARMAFMSAVTKMTSEAQSRFDAAFTHVGSMLQKTFSSFQSSNYRLDLDTSSLKQAATEATYAEERLKQLRDAAVKLAEVTGDRSQQTQAYVQALRAQAVAAGEAAREAQEQVRIYTSLQQTVDGLTAKNKALADSYRATFAEQARAANRANEAQKTFNSFAAPGIDNRAINNGAGYSALAGLARQQDEAEKAAAAMAQLRSAEEAAARGSDLVAATYRNTSLELGRVQKSARDSAQAFEYLFQAADAKSAKAGQDFFNTALGIDAMSKSARESAAVFEQMFAEQEKAAKAQAELAQSAMQLRREMDPTLAIQQKFDAEMSRADDLLRAGAISQREYAQATALARENLQTQHAALFQTAEAAKQGTTANHMMVNSVRAQRVAMVQAGQQMQDMAIQFQMGTKASTILAQQLPQLGFAFSGLAGNSNKALDRLGQFGTFIAGPWGAALTIGLVALGPLIDRILQSGEEAEKASKRHRTMSEVLMDEKASIKEVTDALEEYSRAQQKATEVDILSIKTRAEAIASKLKDAIATRELIKAELERAEGTTRRGAQSESQDVIRNASFARADSLRQQAQDNQALIDKLNVAAFSVRNETARYVADLESDPEKKIKEGFAIQRRQVQGLAEDYSVVEKRLKDINRQEKAALDALRKTTSERREGASSGLYGREIGMAEARSIAASAGFRVNSGTRPTWIRDEKPGGPSSQERLYNKWIAEGRPKDNPTAPPGTSAHESSNALDIQFGKGITAASIKKAYADEGVRLTKILKERGHFHIEWSTKGADKVEREAEQLAAFGKEAAERIMRINEAFDEQPRLIDRANQATRELDSTIEELRAKKPVDWEKSIADAEAAKDTIREALVRPYQEIMRESERRIEIEALLAAGREDEAEALRIIWQYEERNADLREDQKAAILDQVKYERQITEELRARQDIIGAYLDASRSVKQELVSIFSGSGSIGNLQNTFKKLNAEVMVDKIFGPMFRDLDKWVKEQSGVTSSVDFFADETKRAGTEAGNLANALSAAGKAITGSKAAGVAAGPIYGGAANDNSLAGILQRINEQSTADIVVMADKTNKEIKNLASNLSPDVFARQIGEQMARALGDALPGLFGGKAAQGILGGAMYGNMVGGAPGAVLGAIGGIPGLPSGLANFASMGLQGLSGAGMITDIAASFGIKVPTEAKYGLLTGLFKAIFGGAKYGNASFQNGVMSINGNNGDLKTGAQTSGDNLLATLNQIADGLDATLGAFSVSLGQTDGKWRISTTGRTGELKSKYSDVQVFGTGDAAYQQALEAAIRDAISDGAIQGISQAAQNILKAGGDLQKAIEKAALVQSIPKQLKQMTDPVGYAIDELNREFAKVVDALQLGSASAAEYADAEKLYNLKRAEAIRQASEQVMGSLKSLYEDLTVGNEALSLRDRLTGAYSKYNPLAERVAAGDSTAYGDFADAARTLLDLERQLNGSQGGYFSLLQSVTALSKSEMDRQQAMIDAASSSANPFSSNAIAANDNQGVIDAIAQSNNLLSAINQNMILMLQTGTGGGYSYDMSGFSVGMYY